MPEKVVTGISVNEHQGTLDKIWLSLGILSSKGLEISQTKILDARQLPGELSSMRCATSALGFPFSFPVEFLEFTAQKAMLPNFQSWQEFVVHLLSMPEEEFRRITKEFKKEPLRITDKPAGGHAVSPLHSPWPQIVFHGVRLLAALDPARFSILPFGELRDNCCSIIEVNPGRALDALKLPSKGTPGEILQILLESKEKRKLSFKEHPSLFLKPSVMATCNTTRDALDSVLACYMAALWTCAAVIFADPYEIGDENVLLESWTYVPSGV